MNKLNKHTKLIINILLNLNMMNMNNLIINFV